ncbi:hypothetical protein CYLTODRAFT_402177 [Cylindrobasidium torrendii FP15055 ss-10]|uniref:NADH dehydrogenase [ubiquinone] 1 alpha subcomplex subunit n=1 Tax=Cylindrobasidium torrendii FP15055 ss-10 TaxID=1314674 RepID=A0A0D7B1Y5_9AGAR|nr:hypothetical protein CYLTODRAFT_402177 [Cylindrobasidium torrendii FP15055 ss-10]
MSSFFSRLHRVWRTIRHPTGYVGRDLEGNMFFEKRNPLPDARRMKRTVEYATKDAYWDYIGGKKRLPAQWSAWLSHTRIDAPTWDELQRDMARQQQLKIRVAAIEQRDREEKMLIARQQYEALNPPPPQQAEPQPAAKEPVAAPQQAPRPGKPLPKVQSQGKDDWEPQAWTAKPVRRGA